MKIEFPGHEEELESIEVFLERHTFPDLDKIKNFLNRLTTIDKSLDIAIQSDEIGVTALLEDQKELIKRLTGRCHQLEIRRDVIDFAEAAEKLANSSPERSTEDITLAASLLRDKIDQFVKMHRPSRTNAKFIRFARACIDKAEKHEPVVIVTKQGKSKIVVSLDSFREKETSQEKLDLAETLYDLARMLYQERFDDFEETLLNGFSLSQQKEIYFHVVSCNSNLSDLKNQTYRLKAVQGILGYAHDLADYYMGDTPYPSIVEIHNIFQDLDFITHTEEEER